MVEPSGEDQEYSELIDCALEANVASSELPLYKRQRQSVLTSVISLSPEHLSPQCSR